VGSVDLVDSVWIAIAAFLATFTRLAVILASTLPAIGSCDLLLIEEEVAWPVTGPADLPRLEGALVPCSEELVALSFLDLGPGGIFTVLTVVYKEQVFLRNQSTFYLLKPKPSRWAPK
jgi:hypothetical protein